MSGPRVTFTGPPPPPLDPVRASYCKHDYSTMLVWSTREGSEDSYSKRWGPCMKCGMPYIETKADARPPLIDGCRITHRPDGVFVCHQHLRRWSDNLGCPTRFNRDGWGHSRVGERSGLR